MRWLHISGGVGVLVLLANVVGAQELAAIPSNLPSDQPSSFMHVFGEAEPPLGFVIFCHEDPRECPHSSNSAKPVAVSPPRLSDLEVVNRWVNQSITPVTDFEHYG